LTDPIQGNNYTSTGGVGKNRLEVRRGPACCNRGPSSKGALVPVPFVVLYCGVHSIQDSGGLLCAAGF
jgi:hypothetical protein